MASAIFEWDDENAGHMAQHHVETDEAEAVFDNKPLVLRSQGGKCVAYGQSDEGRYLMVVFVRKSGMIVVTARDLAEGEKKRFKRRKK